LNIQLLASLTKRQNMAYLQLFQRVAIGVSGGVDSIALLHVFLRLKKEKIISDLVVLHVNFGLRGKASDLDERFVEGLCHKSNVPFFSIRAKKPAKGISPSLESMQMWARRIRHDFFRKYAKSGYQIALGHTEDDLAENVLYRLVRGYRPQDLAGMREVDAHIWRPFIRLPKNVIIQAMTSSKLLWREDRSNKSAKYARNIIRHKVVPVLDSLHKGAGNRLANLGRFLQQCDDPEISGSEKEKKTTPAIYHSHKLDLNAKYSKTISKYSTILDGVHIGLILRRSESVFCSSWVKATQMIDNNVSKTILKVQVPPAFHGPLIIKTARPDDKVKIADSNLTFKFRELMQKWRVQVSDRHLFLLTSSSSSISALHRIDQHSGKTLEI
jgi:tRNA(Ile)-lysidine synthetase-like protein